MLAKEALLGVKRVTTKLVVTPRRKQEDGVSSLGSLSCESNELGVRDNQLTSAASSCSWQHTSSSVHG